MARRHSSRGISKSRVYKLKNAARIVGVSLPTFRKWAKQALNVITDDRPHIVRGADLIDFLNKREAENKVILGDGQFLCMRCDMSRDAKGKTLIYIPTTAKTGRLSALCETCEAKVGRFSSPAEARALGLLAQRSRLRQVRKPRLARQIQAKRTLHSASANTR